MRYTFEWNPIKAKHNQRKHGVSFDCAAEVFADRLAISIADAEHSGEEDRWISLGRSRGGRLLVVVHTFLEVSTEECEIRIISARKATKREFKRYEETER